MLAFLPVSLFAQNREPLVLAGRLVRVGAADSTPLAGTVLAHRISEAAQGAVDSARTDARGRFRFRIAAPESGAVYVVSARHAGIGYFSQPFTSEARTGADAITLAVFDTASAGPPLAIAVRHLVVQAPEAGGARRVLDLTQVLNAGTTTRVARDSLTPVWSGRLPAGAEGPAAGAGDVPANAVRFVDGRIEVAAAFPPGQKQIVVTYTLPDDARELVLNVDQPIGRLEVLVEDSTAAPAGALQPDEPLTLEGRRFAHFAGGGLAAGTRAAVRFGRDSRSRGLAGWLIVGAAALALAGGAVLAARRARPAPLSEGAAAKAPGPAELPDERLLAAIVALDARYEGREAAVSPAEWLEYQRRRAELKAALAARVARA